MKRKKESLTSVRSTVIKAYKNMEFLSSSEARTLRILGEYLEPAARFKKYGIQNTVVFFGSARALDREKANMLEEGLEEKIKMIKKPSPSMEREKITAKGILRMVPYYEAAEKLAFKLTQWSLKQTDKKLKFAIASGGAGGMMCAASKGAKDAGGLSIGLNISLPMEQEINPHISTNLGFDFHYFFMRKFWFIYLAKALVIFPGGFGTFDELMEALTLIQTGKLEKSLPVVLFGKEFWSEVICFEKLVEWGVISPEDKDLFLLTDDINEAHRYITKLIKQNVDQGVNHKKSLQ